MAFPNSPWAQNTRLRDQFLHPPVPLHSSTDVNAQANLHQLCDKCRHIAQTSRILQQLYNSPSTEPLELKETFTHHETLTALESAMRQGCHLCTLIAGTIEEDRRFAATRAEHERLRNKNVLLHIGGREPMYKLKILGRLSHEHIESSLIVMFDEMPFGCNNHPGLAITRYDRRFRTDFHPFENPSVSTASTSSFECARLWLNECLENHPGCRKTENETRPPTRLVKVGSADAIVSCRLYLTRPGDRNMPYLTLSHCWGDAKAFKLTHETLESMLENIQLDLLPQTFKDAIHITQKLGYQYIWIDSLCILQDDQDDWIYESSTMVNIYSNSVLTIAALWGCNSDSGCFIERKPLERQDCYIQDWAQGGIYVESTDRRLRDRLSDVAPAPLYKRAWVLQERLLSPRVLCYGPFQLHWECFELQLDEMSPKGNISMHSGPDLMKSRFKELQQFCMPRTESIYQQPNNRLIYDNWCEIKCQYWNSDLTFKSDVLVAFSGILASIHKITGMSNSYGLWAEFLELEILWCVENPTNTVRSSAFPTWSWASVQGTRVKHNINTYVNELGWFEKECKVQISVEWTPSLESLPGSQDCESSRTLRINGPLLATFLRQLYVDHYRAKQQPLVDLNVKLDHHIPRNRRVYLLQVTLFESERFHSQLRPYQRKASSGLVLLPVEARFMTFQRAGTWAAAFGEVPKFTKSGTLFLV